MALADMPIVQIAIWNGYVFGSGAGICMRAPFSIATDNTEWAMPESVAGFITDNGVSHFFANKLKDISLGLYLGITGQRVVGGKEVLKWGICTHYVKKELISDLKKALI